MNDFISCNKEDCKKCIEFESQRAYETSGAHTENGAVAYCSDHGGSDFVEDPAEKLYRRELKFREMIETVKNSGNWVKKEGGGLYWNWKFGTRSLTEAYKLETK